MSEVTQEVLPSIVGNLVDHHIDATPDGHYALRILLNYRSRCNERWVVHGLSESHASIYEIMNADQEKRARELDLAIAVLAEHLP